MKISVFADHEVVLPKKIQVSEKLWLSAPPSPDTQTNNVGELRISLKTSRQMSFEVAW